MEDIHIFFYIIYIISEFIHNLGKTSKKPYFFTFQFCLVIILEMRETMQEEKISANFSSDICL